MDKKIGSSEAHSRLLKETLLYLGTHAADICRVWRNESGMALNIRTEQPFHYGLKGSADIMGIVIGGKIIGLEIKTGNASQSQEQKNFEAMLKKFGGIYHVVRSKEEALMFIKEEVKCKSSI